MKVRKALERVQQEYDPEDWYDNLCGACAVGSYLLMAALARKGIKVKAAIAPGHCFLIYKDKIIDVTATQFGHYDKVVIKPLKEGETHRYWNAYFTTNNPYELLDQWTNEGCPSGSTQHPETWIEEGLLPVPDFYS